MEGPDQCRLQRINAAGNADDLPNPCAVQRGNPLARSETLTDHGAMSPGGRHCRTGSLIGLAFPALLFWGISASPARAARMDPRERAAKKACMTGDPVRGVAILADLYIDTDDPTYVFNQGRCYEQNNRFEEAIGRFREYLRKAKNTAEKADAERHIADCQRLLGKKEAEPDRMAAPVEPARLPLAAPAEPAKVGSVMPPEPTGAAPAAPPASRSPEPLPLAEPIRPPSTSPGSQSATLTTAGEVSAQPEPGPAMNGRGLRLAGVVTLSVGVAALATGLAANLKYNGMVGDMQKSYDPSTENSSKTYHTLSLVGYGVGAACLAGGAVLYYIGWRAGQVSVAPMAATGVGGASIQGVF
jgi:tetratricopeptide (TPR) repeat protein